MKTKSLLFLFSDGFTTEFRQRCFHLPTSPYTKNGRGASQGTPPCNNVVTQPTKRHWGLSRDPAVEKRGLAGASQGTPPCKTGTCIKTNGIGAF